MRALPLLVTNENKISVVLAMSRELGSDVGSEDLAVHLFETGLPPLASTSWLPFLFGVSPKLVGAMSGRSQPYYRTFRLNKKRGGHRDIVAPRRFLKTIQRWLLVHVVEKLPVASCAHGFVRDRSIFSNASVHVGSRNLLNIDIEDFFPSVSERQVLDVLGYFPFPDAVKSQLTGLCTLGRRLPQGAPTSPALANAVFRNLDIALSSKAFEWGVEYSRYADDISFSGDRKFTNGDVRLIAEVLGDSGFRINSGKTSIRGAGQRKVVAGLVVNEVARPTREKRRLWRAVFDRAQKHPKEFIDRREELKGIAAFVAQYDPMLSKRYSDIAEEIDSH